MFLLKYEVHHSWGWGRQWDNFTAGEKRTAVEIARIRLKDASIRDVRLMDAFTFEEIDLKLLPKKKSIKAKASQFPKLNKHERDRKEVKNGY